ncbi:MAG: hypothetical protein J1G04_04705 [Clostridiales bacterium]|nr:hypothetical protein [Clostridiales bacterium]
MSSQRNTKNRRLRFVSIIACVALCLCATLSFIFNIDTNRVKAAAAATDDIRFVQVAAGEDFAIGLTYDGNLYGWSLTNDTEQSITSSTLGGYYTATPTKIAVTLTQRQGAIKQIAATRHTAAFITTSGYIFTWGQDTGTYTDLLYQNGSERPHHLLLRTPGNTAASGAWYVPTQINYSYYDEAGFTGASTHGLPLINPESNSFSNISIAAGEYNYIIAYLDGTPKWCTFVWGSLLYSVSNTEPDPNSNYIYDGGINGNDITASDVWGSSRAVYQTRYDNQNTITAVAGGYNVGVNGSSVSGVSNATTLTLRGKNFLTNVNMPISSDTQKMNVNANIGGTQTSAVHFTKTVGMTSAGGSLGTGTGTGPDADDVSNIIYTYNKTTAYTVYNSILGGNRGSGSDITSVSNGVAVTEGTKPDIYYARQSTGALGNLTYATKPEVSDVYEYNIINATGAKLNSGANTPQVIHSAVSLGNGVGYAIAQSGSSYTLYAWGDNTYSQLATSENLNGLNYSDTPRKVSTLSGKNIVSVAAGKQLSAQDSRSNSGQVRAFNSQTGTFSSLTNDQADFAAAVKNESSFVTGALSEDGELYLWGRGGDNIVTAPTQVYFSDVDAKKAQSGTFTVSNSSKFVAVYSGYGNNIFAITKLGKLVRFTLTDGDKFVGEVYDSFKDTNGVINNWELSSTNNHVNFTVVANGASDMEPRLGSFTAFIDNAYASKDSIELNNVNNKSAFGDKADHETTESDFYTKGKLEYTSRVGSAGTPLVASNRIGDVYRILTNDDFDSQIEFTSTTSNAAESYLGEPLGDKATPVFYFGSDNSRGVKMSPAQVANMLDWAFEYKTETDESGTQYTRVGLRITPKQSSNGATITVQFLIGRYDYRGNYVAQKADGGAVTTSKNEAVYYDYKEASFAFTIANTESYQVISAFVQEDNSEKGQSYLPLLDPLNDQNKQYSVALMDVTTGVHRLVEYLEGKEENELGEDPHTQQDEQYDADPLVKSIHDAMKHADAGYPDKAKVEAGDLKYYLRNWESAYNDKYKFMFADRDGDMHQIDAINVDGGINTISAVKQTITISDILLKQATPGDTPLGYTLDESITGATDIYRDFNNKYGFYGFRFYTDPTSGDTLLEFRYDIVRFTATGASGGITYNTSDVNGYNTTENIPHLGVNLNVAEYPTKYAGTGSNAYRPNTTAPSIVYSSDYVACAYSQPTLRASIGGEVFTGNSQRKHEAEIEYNQSLAVGSAYKVKLDDFVAGSSRTYDIRFSYKNGFDTTKNYAEFNKQFVDKIGETSYQTVELKRDPTDGDVIVVTPAFTHDIYFTLSIQRYYGTNHDQSFGVEGRTDEKVTVTFRFTNIKDVDLVASQVAQDTTYYIATTTTFDIFDGIVSLNRELYGDKVTISSLSSSDNSVLKVAPVEGSASKFTATPLTSGTVSIQFIVSAYGKSVFVSLGKVNVSGVTEISDRIELIDVQYVYVNSMLNELRRTNSFNADIDEFGIIYGDNYVRPTVEGDTRSGETVYNAVYFTDLDGNVVSMPAYIKSVKFVDTDTNNPRMRVELDSEQSNTDGAYKLHVRYVDLRKGYNSYEEAEADGAAIIETSELVSSSKRIVKENDVIYTINIDCDNPQDKIEGQENSNWWSEGKDEKTRVYIPVRYILAMIGVANPDEYRIFLVTSTEAAANYFNYSSNNEGTRIIIDPLYNTPAPISINVSVRPTTQTTGGNQILSFRIAVTGISTTLSKQQYTTIWLVAFFASFGVLLIVFIIRLVIYWKRRAKQRALIKRNQELIRMRDRVHNKSTSATRQQIVKTKMKMEDPRYAKMVHDMKKAQRGEQPDTTAEGLGVTIDNMSDPNAAAADDTKGKKKKKKGGKKSIAELKAELAAKKAAVAQAQAAGGDFGAAPMDGGFGVPPMDGGFGAAPMDGGFGAAPMDGGFGAPPMDGGFGGDDFGTQSLDVDAIVFDAPDMGNGPM